MSQNQGLTSGSNVLCGIEYRWTLWGSPKRELIVREELEPALANGFLCCYIQIGIRARSRDEQIVSCIGVRTRARCPRNINDGVAAL